MKKTKSDFWKAFLPNFLAVMVGIIITFGTERGITYIQTQRNVRQIISMMKEDLSEDLSQDREWIKKWLEINDCMSYVREQYDRKNDFSSVSLDTLGLCINTFVSPEVTVDNNSSVELFSNLGVMKDISNKQVTDDINALIGLQKIRGIIREKMRNEIDLAVQSLYESGSRQYMRELKTERAAYEAMARWVMENNTCYSMIFCNRIRTYVLGIASVNATMEEKLASIQKEGY